MNDFKPTRNINFGRFSDHSFIFYPIYADKIKSGEIVTLSLFGDPSRYSKDELRLKRNTIYARHGYAFSSSDLTEYFSQFEWYIPNPNLTMEDIELSEWEKEYVEEIIRLESLRIED